MAPEVVKQTGHSRFADIWSLGCTVFEMLAGCPPWSDKKHMQVLMTIASTRGPPVYPQHTSEELKDFLNQCFKLVPNTRANSYELLRHPFITRKFGSEDNSQTSGSKSKSKS
jgi:serine/threonine protein kinase